MRASSPTARSCQSQTAKAEREAFAREFLAARALEASGPARAPESYRALLAWQPGFAETHYRLAVLLEREGAWEEAYEQFVRARDLDGLPVRCVSSFQDVYREVAVRHDCVLVDGQALFHEIGVHGLLDDHLFVDAMHPTLKGHVALAQAVLDAIGARGALGLPRGTQCASDRCRHVCGPFRNASEGLAADRGTRVHVPVRDRVAAIRGERAAGEDAGIH